jgi:Protein of unknown function (DUF3800)
MSAPIRHGPTVALSLALFHSGSLRGGFVIVTVFIDESGTHGSPVTILAGWVGRLGQWAQFDSYWRKLLKRRNLTYFHSSKLKHSQGEFKGWKVSEKQAFMAAAAKAGEKHLEFGFSIILGEDDYQAHYVAGHRPREVPLDSRYGLCFRYCLGLIPSLARDAFGDRELEIRFVLESGHPNLGDADRIFQKVKRSTQANEQEIVGMLKTSTTGDKIDFPGLQIADVIAYNSFQHATRRPFPTTWLDNENCMADAKARQRVPILHMPLKERELARFRQFILDEVEEKRARKLVLPRIRFRASNAFDCACGGFAKNNVPTGRELGRRIAQVIAINGGRAAANQGDLQVAVFTLRVRRG